MFLFQGKLQQRLRGDAAGACVHEHVILIHGAEGALRPLAKGQEECHGRE